MQKYGKRSPYREEGQYVYLWSPHDSTWGPDAQQQPGNTWHGMASGLNQGEGGWHTDTHSDMT